MITISLFFIFLTVCHQNNILYGLEYTDITRVVTTTQSTLVRYGTDRWTVLLIKCMRLFVIVHSYSKWFSGELFTELFLKGTLALDKISSAWGRGFEDLPLRKFIPPPHAEFLIIKTIIIYQNSHFRHS